jgi:hypothetical protein
MNLGLKILRRGEVVLQRLPRMLESYELLNVWSIQTLFKQKTEYREMTLHRGKNVEDAADDFQKGI